MAVNDEIFKNLAQYGGGAINERVYNFLGSLGYTGTISDRLGQFEEGGRKGWQGLIRAWGQWAPAQLFSQGQEGVWYEPKPVVAGQQVLYQDSAGTTPVEADGDPVGLMLDRSRGLVLGPELVTNGEFDEDTNGWVGARNNETLSVVNGKLRVTANSSGAFGASYLVQTPKSASYVFSGVVGDVSPAISTLAARSNTDSDMLSGNDLDFSILGDDSFRAQIRTGVNRYYGFIGVADAAGDYFEVDNISVRELPGNHATQSTSAARPIYRTDGVLHWLEPDGVDDVFSLPALDLSAGFSSFAYRDVPTSSTTQALLSSGGGGYIRHVNTLLNLQGGSSGEGLPKKSSQAAGIHPHDSTARALDSEGDEVILDTSLGGLNSVKWMFAFSDGLSVPWSGKFSGAILLVEDVEEIYRIKALDYLAIRAGV